MSFVFQSALSSAFPGVCSEAPPVDVSGNGPGVLPLDPTTGNIIPFKPSSDTCAMGRSCSSTLKASAVAGRRWVFNTWPPASRSAETVHFALRRILSSVCGSEFVWGSSRLKTVNQQANPDDTPARANMLIAKATSGSRVFARSLSMVSGNAEW